MEFRGTVKSNCGANDTPRTRTSGCNIEPGLINGVFATPKDATFPVDEAEFNERLHEYIVAGKIIPLKELAISSTSGGDIASETREYGDNVPVGINPPSFTFRANSGGVCLEKEIAKLDRRQMRFMLTDQNGKLWRTITVDKDGKEVARGFLGIGMSSITMAQNPTTPTKILFTVGFDTAHRTEWLNSDGIDLTGNTDGLMGIELVKSTDGTVHIVGVCSGEDVGKDIAAMADAQTLKGAFINKSGGAATTATINPDTGAVTLAPLGSYRIAPVSVLDGLDIVGFDGIDKFVQAGE